MSDSWIKALAGSQRKVPSLKSHERAAWALQEPEGQEFLKKLWDTTVPSRDKPSLWNMMERFVQKWLRTKKKIELSLDDICVVPNAERTGFAVYVGPDIKLLVVDDLDTDEVWPTDTCTCMRLEKGKRHG